MDRSQQQRPYLAALAGRYSVQHLRGQGSFAEVWEARHRRTGHKVAVKIICPAKAGVPMAKVQREIRVMRLLRHHPHIIRLHEALASADGCYVYLVMELAEQGQLHDHVSILGRLPEAEARRVFQQIVAGAAYCHRNMVVHRDLKMENILLDSRGNVKIIDFGFSKLFRYTKVLSTCCGSPEYAAPELHAGRKYVGPEVDVWSCGVILYAMLCGALPFDGANLSDLQRNIRRGEFRLPCFVSDDARDLICSMLIVKPEKRMSMAEVRDHRWLRRDMPPYLLQPPPPFPHLDAAAIVHGATVDEAVNRHGFDRDQLLHSLRNGLENEATVAYHLILMSKHLDRYLLVAQTQTAAPAPPELPQWSLGGVHVGDECPRKTMQHIARAAQELGILCTSSRTLLCACFPGGVVPSASLRRIFHADTSSLIMKKKMNTTISAAVFFEIQLYKAAGDTNNKYVVDLKRIAGPQLDYLRICSQLASKLRQIYH